MSDSQVESPDFWHCVSSFQYCRVLPRNLIGKI